MGAMNFFGDDPRRLFKGTIVGFTQIPLVGRFSNFFVTGPVSDGGPPDQCAFNYDNILEINYLELYGKYHFEALD